MPKSKEKGVEMQGFSMKEKKEIGKLKKKFVSSFFWIFIV